MEYNSTLAIFLLAAKSVLQLTLIAEHLKEALNLQMPNLKYSPVLNISPPDLDHRLQLIQMSQVHRSHLSLHDHLHLILNQFHHLDPPSQLQRQVNSVR